jgi:CHASE2 domain-containing sensor protein
MRVTALLKRLTLPLAGLWGRMRSVVAIDRFRSQWHRLTDLQRLFLGNIIVAVMVASAIAVFHQNQWLLRLENSAMDLMMEFNKGLPRMSDTGAVNPLRFAYLDIDEPTFRSWHEPYHVPRRELKKLIEYAANSKAKLIVVDIDLSRPGTSPENDQELANYLSQYGSMAPQPPIILVRNFYNGADEQRDWLDVRPSFLDDYELSANIHWSQPLFRATLWDGVVRYWHLVKPGCLGGQMVLLPSVQLTAAGILSEPGDTRAARSANPGPVVFAECGLAAESGEQAAADHPWRANAAGVAAAIDQRIIYTMPWTSPSPDLITVSARTITGSSGLLSPDIAAGRVVIIGASYAESRDIHRTPIGMMPGALIIANAIKSLALFGQISLPPAWLQWALKLVVIVFAAWTFLAFRSLLAVGVAGGVIIFVLVPVSFHFFKYGLWIDFALPLFAMLMHRAFAEYRGAQREARDIGRRYRGKET